MAINGSSRDGKKWILILFDIKLNDFKIIHKGVV